MIAGLRRAQARGVRVGRPRRYQVNATEAGRWLAAGASLRAVARQFQVHPSAVRRAVGRATV